MCSNKYTKYGVEIGRPPDVTYEQIKTHMLEHPEQPLTVYSHLTDDEIRRWRTEFEKWTAPKEAPSVAKNTGLDLGRPHGRVFWKRITGPPSHIARRQYARTCLSYFDRLDKPRAVRYQQIKDHIFARRPLPLILGPT